VFEQEKQKAAATQIIAKAKNRFIRPPGKSVVIGKIRGFI
jgi:hypothetical protein